MKKYIFVIDLDYTIIGNCKFKLIYYKYMNIINSNPNKTAINNTLRYAELSESHRVTEIHYTKFYTSITKYLDSLSYQSIYERELDEILCNLPYICLSHISSKKLLNYNNNINLIDLDKEYPEID